MGNGKVKNMKVLMSGDSKPYQQSVAQASNSTKKFKKDASGALNDVANAFGVNLGPITGFTNKYTASLKGVYGGLVKTKSGAGIFSAGMKIVKMAMISTGIGALIVGFGALMAYFTKTQRGADKLKQMFAGVSAITDVLTDRASALGEKLAKAFSDPKKAVKDLWEFIKTNFLNKVSAIGDIVGKLSSALGKAFDLDFSGAKEELNGFGASLTQAVTGFDEGQQKKIADSLKSVGNEMRIEAGAAASLEKQLQALRDKEIALEVTQSERINNIGRLRLESERKDKYSAEQRLAMLDKADKIEKQGLADEKALLVERADIMQRQIDLGESMAEDFQNLASAKAAVNDIDTRSLKLQRTIEAKRQSVIAEINKETAATAKLISEKNKLLGLDSNGKAAKLESKTGAGVTAPTEVIGLRLDNEQLQADTEIAEGIWNDHVAKLQGSTVDMSGAINQALTDAAVGVGEMLGDLMSGSASFEAFGSVIAGAMANMAIQVGETAIATGVASLAIKQALNLKNPALAIAAGIALVALGTAAKNRLANISTGGSSGSMPSSSIDTRSSYGSSALPSSQSQTVQVQISGTMKASGGDLVATIENENQRVAVAT